MVRHRKFTRNLARLFVKRPALLGKGNRLHRFCTLFPKMAPLESIKATDLSKVPAHPNDSIFRQFRLAITKCQQDGSSSIFKSLVHRNETFGELFADRFFGSLLGFRFRRSLLRLVGLGILLVASRHSFDRSHQRFNLAVDHLAPLRP